MERRKRLPKKHPLEGACGCLRSGNSVDLEAHFISQNTHRSYQDDPVRRLPKRRVYRPVMIRFEARELAVSSADLKRYGLCGKSHRRDLH